MSAIPKEQIVAAYQNAPETIQETFNSEDTARVIDDIRTKYRLHVDTAGTIGYEVGYLLLGLRSPAEFFGNLMLSGTDEQTARGIMEEINQRIFIPLNQRVRQTPPTITQNTNIAVEAGEDVVAPDSLVPPVDIPPSPPETPIAPAPTPVPTYQPQSVIQTPQVPFESPITQTLPGSSVPVPQQPWTPPAPSQPVPAFSGTKQSPFDLSAVTAAPLAPPVQQGSFVQSPITTPDTSSPSPIRKEFGADPYREPV